MRYEIDLRAIFYQWPKVGLGLDVEAEIQILKVIYAIRTREMLIMHTYMY